MSSNPSKYTAEEIDKFKELLIRYQYDYAKLAYIIFPFGQKGHEMEKMAPYDWQIEEWNKMSAHFSNPATRDKAYKLCVSSGNGAAKTAFGAMTTLMLMFTQHVRGRITANTDTQMRSVVWPEYDIWAGRARYFDHYFEKFGTSIKAQDASVSENWRFDTVTWSENSPAAMSGLHNYGKAIVVVFEEAAGIPAKVWEYANGAMTDVDTIKVWMAFANSDDPDSQFEQNMNNVIWKSRRIDTRTLKHVSKDFVSELLADCGGNEDADDFRIRVRGLPRKSNADSIISAERVANALARPVNFPSQVALPCVMTADLAWRGGDYCAIWIHQGNSAMLVAYYKLSADDGTNHVYTYQKMCALEKEYKVDYVLIDQAEGTAVYSMAQAAYKHNWELVSFASAPNDTAEFRDSQYQNMRAQMYYEGNKWLGQGGCIGSVNPDWIPKIQKELTVTKGIRNKTTLKKQAEPKEDIRFRAGFSPDVADGFVLRFSRVFYDRQPENMSDELRDLHGFNQEPEEYNPYENY